MRKRDEIREQIYEIISDNKLTYTQIVERIINLPSIAVVGRDAELPVRPVKGEAYVSRDYYDGYIQAEQDMVNQGWVKEVVRMT